LSNFSFPVFAQSPPENLEEAKEIGEKAVEEVPKELPGIIGRIWENEVLPIWRKMYEIWSNFWNNTLKPWLSGICNKIKEKLGMEIEERKPKVKEEFEKEKEELKEEVPEVGKSLWEKFKEIIK